jgi:hypothetical protein
MGNELIALEAHQPYQMIVDGLNMPITLKTLVPADPQKKRPVIGRSPALP